MPYRGSLGSEATLLDVGTGLGDVPRSIQQVAAHAGVSLRTFGLDTESVLLKRARENVSHAVCASRARAPVRECERRHRALLADAAPLSRRRCRLLLREMHRVARVAVIVSDLRRSWIAAGGFWLASYALRFHGVTRHDGVVSVLRGFTQEELADTVESAVGVRPLVHRRLGFRITAAWRPVAEQ